MQKMLPASKASQSTLPKQKNPKRAAPPRTEVGPEAAVCLRGYGDSSLVSDGGRAALNV